MSPKVRIPLYRFHEPSGRAVVILGGEWLARGAAELPQNGPDGPSVNEVILACMHYADTYYRDEAGNPTLEVPKLKQTFKALKKLYGETPASEFGPVALQAVRQHLIDAKLCRKLINQRVGHIKRMFRRASSEEMIPPAVYHGLTCVDGLRRGRSAVRETDPVKPVPDAHVDAVLPFLCPTVRAMVRLQRMTHWDGSLAGSDLSSSAPSA